MHRSARLRIGGALLLAGLAAGLLAPALHGSGPLDWDAPNRWVHVDTVGAGGVALFEGARLRWLKALRSGGTALADGRPLFWSGDHGGVRTYLTFWPFGAMVELDTRARSVAETQARLGKDALEDYDSGDAALVPPHYSQIWRREPGDDFVSPVAGDLTELTGSHGRLQFLRLNLRVAGRVDGNWQELRKQLAARRYPLTCRVFSTRYGVGQTMLLWLAASADDLRHAPSLRDALRAGEPEVDLAGEFARLWSLEQELDIQRRDDLSNLPEPGRPATAAPPATIR